METASVGHEDSECWRVNLAVDDSQRSGTEKLQQHITTWTPVDLTWDIRHREAQHAGADKRHDHLGLTHRTRDIIS
jgi:hypothetical protein